MSQKNSLTWFITGCSSGFGRELTKVVLARGYRAAVTARNTKQVEDLVAGHEDRTLALRPERQPDRGRGLQPLPPERHVGERPVALLPVQRQQRAFCGSRGQVRYLTQPARSS